MNPTTQQKRMDARKAMFEQMEKHLQEGRTPEDSLCKIERLMPVLNKLVEEEMRYIAGNA